MEVNKFYLNSYIFDPIVYGNNYIILSIYNNLAKYLDLIDSKYQS
jgi:hypothetical protein